MKKENESVSSTTINKLEDSNFIPVQKEEKRRKKRKRTDDSELGEIRKKKIKTEKEEEMPQKNNQNDGVKRLELAILDLEGSTPKMQLHDRLQSFRTRPDEDFQCQAIVECNPSCSWSEELSFWELKILLVLLQVIIRWKERKYEDGIKWKFLEHRGPLFAPAYDPLPDDVKFYYNACCNETAILQMPASGNDIVFMF
ncbi:hypothetical protein Y1Q_0010331 [Alligator mississippiensis]|uniref:DNA topoisomerase I DNA binding eukaryotic-type domain-containing protein n=1 Tax=Alligator mississippiensis TaxID=8496 RepID=A0A151NM79_ALLMI|nr:hypothetical protein Y1Q_0010331 [Alligator mississippiensis]